MKSAARAAIGERFIFGDFELAPAARGLWRAGHPVKIGSRALDVLVALTSQPGKILSKDDLAQMVWGGASVDETAVRVAVLAARRALGVPRDRYIKTVPGRGYCFAVDVCDAAAEASHAIDQSPFRPQRLPPQIARVVGREAVIEALVHEVARQRLVSLAGPGGIGKTTVALAAAARVRDSFDALAFVDLAQMEDGNQIAAGVAAALGLNLRLQIDPIDQIAAGVEGRRVLLLADNCEHLVDTAASFVEDLIGRAPGVTVLATSRELLRAAGEWVHRLAPLDVPPCSPSLTVQEARAYSAVEMFEDRAALALGGYRLDDTDAPFVADICQRLDGVALAIELAAGQLARLGVQGLASSLEDRFRVLTHGRRSALPRHQTLRATLDWSYQLLSTTDQMALRALSVFSGSFTIEDAAAVIGRGRRLTEVSDWLASLGDKSLLAASATEGPHRFSLLEITRAYAQEKLIQAEEADDYRQRHAEFTLAVFDRAQAEWERRPAAEWMGDYALQLGNLRTALDWAFSAKGDGAIGAALTAAAAPLWLRQSSLDEGLARVERAIIWLRNHPSPDRRLLMQLYAILGWPRMRAINAIPSGADAWEETLTLAVELDDADYQLRALWGLWIDCANRGAAANALSLANRFTALAERAGDPQDRIIARRLRGKSLHFLGDFAGARRETEQMLALYAPPPQRSHLVRFQSDQRLVAQATLARGMWLEGFADQALAMVEDTTAEAEALGHTLTTAHVLSHAACFVALWAGDLALAARYTDRLRLLTTLHALDVWRTYADAFEGEIIIRLGRAPDGVEHIAQAIETLEAGGFVLHSTAFESVLSEGQLTCGRRAAAESTVARALRRCHASGEAWCLPELMRVQALVLATSGQLADALNILRDGFCLAHTQGALAWQLRLASTRLEIEDTPDARGVLQDVVGRFREGFGTRDYVSALARLQG